MIVTKFEVDLLGTGEALINGRPSVDGKALFEEKVFMKISSEQQWAIACEARKLATELFRAHRASQFIRGEISELQAKQLGVDV